MTSSSDAPARSSARRFIPAEALHGFAAWQPASLGAAQGEGGTPSQAPAPSAAANAAELPKELRAQLAAVRQAGWQDGYREGLAALEGFKQGYRSTVAAQLGELLQAFDAQLSGLEEQLAAAVADTAVLLARQVVRQELQTHPALVAEVARQAVGVLMLSARHITVQVHPDDLALVAEGAHDVLQARNARLLAQGNLQRGGCVVESDIGQVDARIEQRWALATQGIGQAQALAPGQAQAQEAGELAANAAQDRRDSTAPQR